jgi:hypothetical protein
MGDAAWEASPVTPPGLGIVGEVYEYLHPRGVGFFVYYTWNDGSDDWEHRVHIRGPDPTTFMTFDWRMM